MLTDLLLAALAVIAFVTTPFLAIAIVFAICVLVDYVVQHLRRSVIHGQSGER